MTRSISTPSNSLQFVEEVEVGDRLGVAVHGAELDEQIDVALARAEVVAQGRAEDVEARDAVPGAQLGDRLTLVLQNVDHCEQPPPIMLPGCAAAGHSGGPPTRRLTSD